MTESFSQLFEEFMNNLQTRTGSIVNGTVISIMKETVIVDAGLKSESYIPIEQFRNSYGKIEIKVGDKIDVTLESIENGFGETQLSREKAKRHETWSKLEKNYEEKSIVTGVINGKVKGGFTVELDNIRAFLPGSLVDIRPVKDTSYLEGKELEFRVIKLDKKRNNVVISRRAVIESENSIEKNKLLSSLQEKVEVKGIVKNLTDYGAFIDLGGVDGLLHITDMSWKRVKHPSEIVSINDEIIVKILKFDRENTRVSLGLKQLSEDPWILISDRYPENTKVIGKVTNLTDYGCFVEIEEGIEGLVHISEMDWTNKNVNPSKIVNIGEKIKVSILNIDEKRRRISLGIKQCKKNPWKQFFKNYKKGDKIKGKIKSITDFGIFVGLEEGIDGLIHLSDISCNENEKTSFISDKYKKGEIIESVVLQVDPERERISLGIKQLSEDLLENFLSLIKKEEVKIGKIIEKDNKQVTIEIKKGIKGYLKNSDFLKDDLNKKKLSLLKLGENIKVKIIGIDKKNNMLSLLFSDFEEKNVHEKEIVRKKNNKENGEFSNIMSEAFKAANKKDEKE